MTSYSTPPPSRTPSGGIQFRPPKDDDVNDVHDSEYDEGYNSMGQHGQQAVVVPTLSAAQGTALDGGWFTSKQTINFMNPSMLQNENDEGMFGLMVFISCLWAYGWIPHGGCKTPRPVLKYNGETETKKADPQEEKKQLIENAGGFLAVTKLFANGPAVIDFMSALSTTWDEALKFLYARDFNVANAMQLYREHMTAREDIASVFPDPPLGPGPPKQILSDPLFVLPYGSYDRDGCGILIVNLRFWNPGMVREFSDRAGFGGGGGGRVAGEDVNVELAGLHWALEYVIEQAVVDPRIRERGLTLISDVKETGQNINVAEIHFIITEFLLFMLPVKLSKLLIVNNPWWNYFSAVPLTQSIGVPVSILNLDALKNYVEPRYLPRDLGGSMVYKHKEWFADQSVSVALFGIFGSAACGADTPRFDDISLATPTPLTPSLENDPFIQHNESIVQQQQQQQQLQQQDIDSGDGNGTGPERPRRVATKFPGQPRSNQSSPVPAVPDENDIPSVPLPPRPPPPSTSTPTPSPIPSSTIPGSESPAAAPGTPPPPPPPPPSVTIADPIADLQTIRAQNASIRASGGSPKFVRFVEGRTVHRYEVPPREEWAKDYWLSEEELDMADNGDGEDGEDDDEDDEDSEDEGSSEEEYDGYGGKKSLVGEDGLVNVGLDTTSFVDRSQVPAGAGAGSGGVNPFLDPPKEGQGEHVKEEEVEEVKIDWSVGGGVVGRRNTKSLKSGSGDGGNNVLELKAGNALDLSAFGVGNGSANGGNSSNGSGINGIVVAPPRSVSTYVREGY
ncbi:Tyrosine-protein phosphatase non-receptor type 9 [Blyttiomyces sp. JEL0837]|nr:Tyrosine-protein phosphatase non-receptor type 9 [Blyttiomyces sp. JEL0837]